MNTHVLPKSNPYKNHTLTVNIIQVLSAIFAGFGVSLWGVRQLLYLKDNARDTFEILPAFMLWCAVFLAVVIAVPFVVGLIARLIINRSNSEVSRLCAQSAPLEWKPVTDKMLEYLKRNRKFPWISVTAFIAVLIALIITGAEYEVCAVILVFTALLCGALGFFICDDTAQCVSENADFATIDVHHTFTSRGVKYAVVYLSEGERVFRLKHKYLHREVKKLVFLSHLTNARLICDEEFINLMD